MLFDLAFQKKGKYCLNDYLLVTLDEEIYLQSNKNTTFHSKNLFTTIEKEMN